MKLYGLNQTRAFTERLDCAPLLARAVERWWGEVA
jgi:hypothetical protein